ncbi:MAG: rhodanese-like domain-containing protein [Armatimonadota bacterium]
MPQQTEEKPRQSTARTITATEVHRRLEAGENLLLVDLMPPSQYLLIHIPGAISIPLDYLHDVLEYLPRDEDIILYCTDEKCEFSDIGARKLALHGFTNVLVIPGGMAEWEAAGLPFATVLLRPDEESHHHHH